MTFKKLLRRVTKPSRTVRRYRTVVGLNGTLRALQAWYNAKAVLFEVKRHDCKFPFWLRLPSSDIEICRQVFINQEYNFSTKKEPHVIIDAGANTGLASIYFANKYPHAKIIAIEPEKSNFETLIKNTAPYPNIVPLQAALWNTNQEIDLIDTGCGKWAFMTKLKNSPAVLPGTTCHTVNSMTIDTLLERCNLEQIDILKIDIEGAEKEVFSDTSSWIDRVDAIIIELHERMKPGCNQMFYRGTYGFENEWRQGERVYLSKSCRFMKPPHQKM